METIQINPNVYGKVGAGPFKQSKGEVVRIKSSYFKDESTGLQIDALELSFEALYLHSMLIDSYIGAVANEIGIDPALLIKCSAIEVEPYSTKKVTIHASYYFS